MKSVNHIKLETSLQSSLDFIKKSRNSQFIFHSYEPIIKIYRKSNLWKEQEKLKYCAFLQENFSDFDNITLNWNVFRKMSKFIGVKNPNQCRIFHKTCSRKATNIGNIIQKLINLTHIQKLSYIHPQLPSKHQKIFKEQKQQDKENSEEKFGTDISELQKTQKILSNIMPSTQESKKMANLNENDWFIDGFKSQRMEMCSDETEKKWRKCHHYFLQWTSRLNQLVQQCPNPNLPV